MGQDHSEDPEREAVCRAVTLAWPSKRTYKGISEKTKPRTEQGESKAMNVAQWIQTGDGKSGKKYYWYWLVQSETLKRFSSQEQSLWTSGQHVLRSGIMIFLPRIYILTLTCHMLTPWQKCNELGTCHSLCRDLLQGTPFPEIACDACFAFLNVSVKLV